MAKKIKTMGSIFSIRVEENGNGTISTNGGVYVLDKISTEIIIRLENKDKIKDIIYDLLKKYDVTFKTLSQDIQDLFDRLYSLKFISYDYYKKIISEIYE